MAKLQEADATAPASRVKSWQFQKGNPGGKLREGKRNRASLLDEAIKKVEARRAKLTEPCTCTLKYRQEVPCKTLDEHFARLAFFDPIIISAVQKKRIPDLQHQTGDAAPTQINILLGHRKVLIAQPEPVNA